MKNEVKNYLFLIGIHVVIGAIIYANTVLAKIYSVIVIILAFYFVIKTRNRKNEVLYAAAYIVGSEVFLRMTGGNINYEFGKYAVMVFLLIGMVYSGISKNAVAYWIYLLLLVPGLLVGVYALDAENIRTTIAFNISGPVCLGIASLYCFNRPFTIKEVNNLLLVMGLPIISCATYVYFYSPDIRESLMGTGSNGALSGGFGPNQVSTVFGLGTFIFFSRLIFLSRSKAIFFINLILAFYISYRGMLTFSRGGMITGLLMIIILIIVIYINSKNSSKIKLNYLIGFMIVIMIAVWNYTSVQTDGYIDKRYANQDATGREKKDQLTGRGELAEGEIEMFLESPFLGVGVAKGTEIRLQQTGMENVTASHNEITRMLAEHGFFGILALLVLFVTPLFLYYDNKQNIFLLCFVTFWLLTINHAAMRTAAPCFIYALSLLKVRFDEQEDTVHRE